MVAATALSRSCSVVPSAAVAHEDAERRVRAPADAAPELVELREAEPLGALDHHQRRLGDVHADLDHGRPHQHVEVAVAEAGHLGVAVRRA